MINCILSTDVNNHKQKINAIKAKIDTWNISDGQNLDKLIEDDPQKTFENQQAVMNIVIHAADISNPGKNIEIYEWWIDLLFNEFFEQGDKERTMGLPISFLCDRKTVVIPETQPAFIKFLVKPTFLVVEAISPIARKYINRMDKNLEYFEKKIAALKEAEKAKQEEN